METRESWDAPEFVPVAVPTDVLHGDGRAVWVYDERQQSKGKVDALQQKNYAGNDY
jgi:hypothetical protein